MSFHEIEIVFVEEIQVELILRIWVNMKLETWWKKLELKYNLIVNVTLLSVNWNKLLSKIVSTIIGMP